MNLYIIVGDVTHRMEVTDDMLTEAEDFFQMMDQDMDKGWQMSREWVENPDQVARCQIAADRLVDAKANGKDTLAQLMAAYILTRMPMVAAVRVDTDGEIFNTELLTADQFNMGTAASAAPSRDPEQAMAQAEKDVAKVYKTGRNYHYAMYDHEAQQWVESPPMADEAQANEIRRKAVERRASEIMAGRG